MGKKAPDPTPPQETSAAATGTNVSTAIANSFLNNPNEITADGTKTTTQTGEYSWTDPYTGQSYTVPRNTVTTTLSDQQKAIKGQQDAASFNLASLGNNLSGTLGQKLQGNFSLGNEAVEGRLMDLGSKRLDPMFAQREEDLRTRLANQGIKAGSDAYGRELNTFNQGRNDAYNQLLLQGRGQASQELLTEDNQRINQVSALLNGGQVSQPNFMTAGYTNSNIAATDNAAIIGNYDRANAAAAAADASSIGGAISGAGGLFKGLGSAGFMLSDERAKEDKQKIGETKDGLGIYSFKYKGDPEHDTEIGLMAQEVKKVKPEAVRTRGDGLMEVDYPAALAPKKKAKR